MHSFHYLRVRTKVCRACQREPDSWGPRGRRLQTDRSDPASREKNQTADPESRTSRPASRPSGRSWSCCSGPRIDRTRWRRIYGWRTSAKPSFVSLTQAQRPNTKARVFDLRRKTQLDSGAIPSPKREKEKSNKSTETRSAPKY